MITQEQCDELTILIDKEIADRRRYAQTNIIGDESYFEGAITGLLFGRQFITRNVIREKDKNTRGYRRLIVGVEESTSISEEELNEIFNEILDCEIE